MNKKLLAIIIEIIPVLSAVISFVLIRLPYDTEVVRKMILITVLLSFFGFVFFFVGRFLAGGDRIVKWLGIADWFATIYIIGLYVLAIFSFGL